MRVKMGARIADEKVDLIYQAINLGAHQ